MLVGKTAWIQLWIDGSTVAGAPSSLNVVMPFTIVVGQSGPILYYVLPNTGWGVYLQQAEDQVVRLYRDLGGAPFAATAGAAVRVALAVQIL
jgi:hypothetical protein